MIPDLSVIWVIGFVLLLTITLDRLLFRPILRTIAQREAAIRSARELAERTAGEAKAATTVLEQQTAAARAEIYKQMDDMRRAALAERAETLAQTRAEAEAGIAEATRTIQAEAENARKRLVAEAESLGQAAAERILGRRAS